VSAGFIVAIVGVVLVVALVVKLRANKSNDRNGDRNVAALPDIYNEPLYDTLNPRRLTVATTAIDDAIPNPTYDAPIIYDATGCRPAPATGRVTDSSNDDAKAVYSLADPSDDAGAAAAAAAEHMYGLRPGRGSVVYDIGSNSARGSLVYDIGNSEAIQEEDDDDDDDGVPVGRMTSTITSMASIMTNWGDEEIPTYEETTYDNPRIEQQEPDEWADVDGLPLRGRTKVLRAPSNTDTDGPWSRIPGIVRRESMV